MYSYILHNIYLKLTFSFYVTLRLNLISVIGGKAESVKIMKKHFKEVVKGRDIDWSSDQNQKHRNLCQDNALLLISPTSCDSPTSLVSLQCYSGYTNFVYMFANRLSKTYKAGRCVRDQVRQNNELRGGTDIVCDLI